MKKVFSIVVLMLAATLFSFGQHYIVKHSDYNRVNLSFKPAEVQVKEVALPEGTYSKVFMEDYLAVSVVSFLGYHEPLPVLTGNACDCLSVIGDCGT